MRKYYIIAIIVYVVAAIFSAGYHHFDEHFQLLEFAGLKLGINTANDLPWEYHNQMRPAFQPAVVVFFYWFFNFFAEVNPFSLAIFLRLLSAAISLSAIFFFIKTFRPKFRNEHLQRWFVLLSLFLWFLVYIGVRFSSESWCGNIFLLAICVLYPLRKKTSTQYFLGGILLGTSFLCRYQAAFLIAGLVLWLFFIKKEKLKNIAWLALGFAIIFFIGILLDYWFYGQWTLTTWHYFEQNILQDKVSNFGSDPAWYYIAETINRALPPFSIIYIASAFIVFIYKPKCIFTWCALPFLLVHHIIGHKEVRFLFPLAFMLPFFIIYAVEILQSRYKKFQNFSHTKTANATLSIFWISNICMLGIVMFRPADPYISLYKFVYQNNKTNTELYYLQENPYNRVLNINFYKRKNLKITHIDSLGEVLENASPGQLIALKNDTVAIKNLHRRHKLVYSTFPPWLRKYNINNWQSRTRAWYVFEVLDN